MTDLAFPLAHRTVGWLDNPVMVTGQGILSLYSYWVGLRFRRHVQSSCECQLWLVKIILKRPTVSVFDLASRPSFVTPLIGTLEVRPIATSSGETAFFFGSGFVDYRGTLVTFRAGEARDSGVASSAERTSPKEYPLER